MAAGERVKPRGLAKRRETFTKPSGGPILACIDMGTNSFHMIVCRARPGKDGFEVITRIKEAAPFFRSAVVSHYIDEDAFGTLKKITAIMLKHAAACGADRIVAVATSAVRESRNGLDVIERLRQELDFDAKTISGKEEARLIYLGVLYSMPKLKEPFTIVDIGGGSTEIIAGDRSNCRFAESYKLGAARLTTRFFKRSRPTSESLKELHDEVRGMLRPAAARVEATGGYNRLIGTSGTVQALAKLDRVQAGKPTASLQGWRIPIGRLEELVSHIEECALSGNRVKGVSNDRSQTILAGAIVLLETMRSMKADELTVCTAALREGVVVDNFVQTGWLQCGLSQHGDPRSQSVHQMLEKYRMDFAHAEQVARLALSIFEQTRGTLHDYGEEVGHILWSASMLHDVGTFVGRNGHHKHSYYLIRHSGLLGHSEEEVAMIASVARYHRGAEPKDTHEAWLTINERSRPVVRDLSAILRVAEALDRSHRQVIETVKVVVSAYDSNRGDGGSSGAGVLSLVPILKAEETCLPETWALAKKKPVFEKTFGVKLDLLVDAVAASGN